MVTQAIFLPGQVCGRTYSILSLHSRSPVAESYLARHKTTRREVMLTCSRLEHVDPGSPMRSDFCANASKLKAIEVEDTPSILDAGVHDGIYWVAREHLADAIPLWEVMTSTDLKAPGLVELKKLLRLAPDSTCMALAIGVGLCVADTLKLFAARGIFHGGLDPTKTIALRSDRSPVVLETGYHTLFGLEHVRPPPDLEDLVAPEVSAGHEPNERSDIYSLGSTLTSIVVLTASRENTPPPPELFSSTKRMMRRNPANRIQRWLDVASEMLEFQKGMMNAAAKAGIPCSAASGAALQPAPETPHSGMRVLAGDKGADTDPCPPPSPGNTVVEESPPCTTPSRGSVNAAPTPRVPEMPLVIASVSILERPPPANEAKISSRAISPAAPPMPAPAPRASTEPSKPTLPLVDLQPSLEATPESRQEQPARPLEAPTYPGVAPRPVDPARLASRHRWISLGIATAPAVGLGALVLALVVPFRHIPDARTALRATPTLIVVSIAPVDREVMRAVPSEPLPIEKARGSMGQASPAPSVWARSRGDWLGPSVKGPKLSSGNADQ